MIAAMYAALTYAVSPIAYGEIQFRISEALTILPIFTPAAIPGLVVGCLIANIGSPMMAIDMIFGTLATLLAAISTYALRNVCIKGIPILAPLPPVIFNALIVGAEIACFTPEGLFELSTFKFAVFLPLALSVGFGELVVCYALGLPLAVVIKKTNLFKLKEPKN